MADYAYGSIDINQDTGRITSSYESMMGKQQPSHEGSQSTAPGKEDDFNKAVGSRYGSAGYHK